MSQVDGRFAIDRSIETPALVIDLDIVDANIDEMAQVARTAGVALRPHVKTHKMPRLALRQIEAGARGITCAKLGEAEVMAARGCLDILVAYPLWGEAKLARLRRLREQARVRVAIDSVEIAEGLGMLGRATGQPVELLVEVDTGHHRLGRAPGAPTIELVREISMVKGVRVVGLLTHGGHAYASRSPEGLRDAAEREARDLVEMVATLQRDGFDIAEVSVGSTPTARVAARVPGVTEIRPGTYVFNDGAMIRLGVATIESSAVRIVSTVVARPVPERAVFDAGSKCLTSDGAGTPDWISIPQRPDVHFEFLTEEHGVARVDPSDGDAISIGSRHAIIPSHVCPCLNLFDRAYGVRGGRVVEELPIEARGMVT